MFRETDPQRPLFSAGGLMSPEKRAQCEKSWAGPFRDKALPILIRHEADFADLFHPDNGRPNRPVPLVVGVLILKEMFDQTDEEALASLDFDVRWMYAFELQPHELHLCERTLHNFRERLMKHEKGKVLFRSVTEELLVALGIDLSDQRLDWTHILSNFAVVTRLGLFCETLRVFLRALQKAAPELYAQVGAGILKRYGEDSAYADARKGEGPRRLGVAARDVYRLIEKFRTHEVVGEMPEFKLLVRLLEEQCELTREAQKPKKDDDDSSDGAVPVLVKEPKKIESDSLQTPHDPDATYSGHKGKGYETQVSETCAPNNPVQMITAVEVTRSCQSDQRATIPVLEELKERGLLPQKLIADTTYGGGENAAGASKMGVTMVCPAPAPSKPKEGKTYERPAEQCPTEAEAATQWLTAREAQPEFEKEYAIRAGSEATNSELKRGHGMKKLRVRGEKRVKLSVYLKAVACNVKRAVKYWVQELRELARAAAGAIAGGGEATVVEAAAAR
jgi:hypothetical protein